MPTQQQYGMHQNMKRKHHRQLCSSSMIVAWLKVKLFGRTKDYVGALGTKFDTRPMAYKLPGWLSNMHYGTFQRIPGNNNGPLPILALISHTDEYCENNNISSASKPSFLYKLPMAEMLISLILKINSTNSNCIELCSVIEWLIKLMPRFWLKRTWF